MEDSRQVTVVGGSSFIGLHPVSQLLDLGINVNATTRAVRALTDDPLALLKQKHPHALNIVAADIQDKDSLAKAFQGSEAIFYLASPVLLQVNDAFKEQIQPTVEGSNNVLEACLCSGSVKTIVITTSTYHSRFPKPGYDYSEKDYHVVDAATEFPYVQAKVQEERDIWDFQKEHSTRFRITIINPSFVFGPEVLGRSQFTCLNSPCTNLGRNLLANYLTGNWKLIPQGMPGYVFNLTV
ncbi:hypothetical protein DSO57_1019863 [Entomophthora muscae]|uniref:Uncharacterized protein n=1 Tax=Entomophthora muscae TaxID=34485 RepID=A0ACC2T491_9FUNG|nr:hypothetical protein DSO57_1019863 [Entomophthora muscae]